MSGQTFEENVRQEIDYFLETWLCCHCAKQSLEDDLVKYVVDQFTPEPESLTEQIRATRERRSALSYYTAPYIGPDTVVGVEIDGQIYTDTWENMQKPPKRMSSFGDGLRALLDLLHPTASEDHIIRSEN